MAIIRTVGHPWGSVVKRTGIIALVVSVAVVLALAALLVSPGRVGASQLARPATPLRTQTYPVASVSETFVDTSRSTPPNGTYPGSPMRTLTTLVLYPRQPAGQHRHFPLVVFSHGFTANGPVYTPVLSPWVAHGYVVAAPTFPLSSGGAPGGPTIRDYASQPGDVSFVITQMLRLDRTEGSPINDLINMRSIGVAGHSLGAITTLGVADNSCCQDPRIDAAISIAGLELPFPGGRYFTGDDSPLLLIHGTADKTLPYAASQTLFADARSPKYFLTLEGAPHTAFFNPWGPVITDTALAFLDRYLKADRDIGHIRKAGTVPGVASIQVHLGQRHPTAG
jgi:fermentation-respiration switch protein FrsA (DUF1100 family)